MNKLKNDMLKGRRARASLGAGPAPVAVTRFHQAIVHGETLRDDYAWLRAGNWREVLRQPDLLPLPVARHLRRENRYCAAILKPLNSLRKLLLKEMRGRMKEDDSAPPQADGAWTYATRYRRGAQHPLHVRKPRQGGREQILLDGVREAKASSFFEIGDVQHSPDHARLAWSADRAGSELHTIHVRDIATGTDMADAVQDTTGEMVWAADSGSFFYVRLDAEHRPAQVFHHVLGQPPDTDRLVHDEADKGMFVHIGRTLSGRFLVIAIGDHETSEARLVALSEPAGPPFCVRPRKAAHLYSVDHHGNDLFILSNEGAEDFRIMTVPVEGVAASRWQECVSHVPGRTILSMALHRNRLIRLERQDGLPRLVIRELVSGVENAVAFDEEAYALAFDAGLEFDSDVIRFTHASMARPAETHDYNMATRTRTLVKRQEVPSGHDTDRYEVRRIFATADDGEEVPVSLVHLKGMKLDGSAPCLLYGYGAYGSSMSASFRVTPLSLVERGFVYAIAHVRGGAEKGRRWYRDGKCGNKRNTFTDFIASAQCLITQGFTSKGRIIAHGGSAGGLLMGAVANMAPDLFGGIIADVPFVDALNTILDDTLPLTPPEWPEWGNPITDRAAFEMIRSYSPYDNVSAQVYPPMLVTAGLTDPRVTYWEPAKWVAKLRATMTGGGPVILHTHMKAGHGGAAGRFDHLKEVARAYAFAMACADGTISRTSAEQENTDARIA
jgi:oligopeptidase B